MLSRVKGMLREVFGHPLLPVYALIMAAVALTTFTIMVDAQRRIIEFEAVKIAEVVARQALAARSVYTRDVADKLAADGFGPDIASANKPGHVPLPAQFLKLVGREASEHSSGLYRYRPLSKWNLDPSQGLRDDFQRWAWTALEAQDQLRPSGAIEWQPVWRFEALDNTRTLRYIRADPASSRSCVNCHNQYETFAETVALRVAAGVSPGKQWDQHQLLGAIEVDIPVDRVEEFARGQARLTLFLVVSISLIGLTVAGWYAFHDSRRKQYLAAQYERQAKFDTLTELPNRVHFHERARDELQRASRDQTMIGLLFVDLDHFKRINDSLGHQFGDNVLQVVAHRLSEPLRKVDTIARHSGDEFTILLHGVEEPQDLARVAHKLLDALSNPFQLGEQELFVSASIGISCYPQDGIDVETLLKNADVAMYRAKEQGRNRYRFFSADMNTRAFETLEISNRLRHAVERGQLVLHYQPLVEARSGLITGVEALLRWQHPDLGLLPPQRFVPLAEDMGLIEPIGEWVLKSACTQAMRWAEAGLRMRVAVNLSTQQFRSPDLLERVTAILRATGFDPHALEFEITESVLMQQPLAAELVLERFHQMGISLAIDDFGTGYSSLAYLKRFAIDYLKIDKSFIDGLPGDNNDRVITTAIIALARNLGMKVVAEGVETEEQRKFLAEAGCDELQGFFFALPASAEEIEPLLRQSAERADEPPGPSPGGGGGERTEGKD